MDNHFNHAYMSYGQGGQPPQHQQSLASFGNLSAHGHPQPDAAAAHPTLPPLQNQNGGYSFGTLSYPGQPPSQSHTPTTPHTPVSSSIVNNNPPNAYSHMSSAPPTTASMMPPSYAQQYAMSSSALYPSQTATTTPSQTASLNLPNLRPMPPAGVTGMSNGLPSLANPQGAMAAQNSAFVQNEETPTHVVGSQGRRGVLPAAPGRPNPPSAGSGASTKSMIPQKDADGKFPCPHCNKTYLHAKHLKRHLLRHTGDRPYMCHLCKDTFSRSDILKRHFQKCSIRRGNPTGANHLAHQRRPTANGATSNGNRLSMADSNGPVGLAGMQDVANAYNPAGSMTASPNTVGNISGRSSRANSIIQPGALSQRNSIAGLGILGHNGPQDGMPSSASAAYQQGMSPAHAMQNNRFGGQQMASAYNFNQPTNHLDGLYANRQQSQQQQQQQQQQQHDQDQGYRHHHHDTQHQQQISFLGQASSRLGHGSASSQSKYPQNESGSIFNDQSFLGSLYSLGNPSEYGHTGQRISGFPNWIVEDPLSTKVDSLVHYCFSNRSDDAIHAERTVELVKFCLSAENVKHFAEHYASFHGHWPILHMPTFKLTEANNALVLAVICIGAVYSSVLTVDQVRQLMEFAQSTIYSRCTVRQRTIAGMTQGLGNNSEDIEELQALIMLQIIFAWHGNRDQRERARDAFPMLIRIAKAMDLCDVARPGHYAYSILHSTAGNQLPDVAAWSWNGWLQQEKRSRLLYLIFLSDAAMTMYFNSPPHLDPFEIRLPLPADDAAWEASTHHECAGALGLNGIAAQENNWTGTRKARQPGMKAALKVLVDPMLQVSPGSTNSYGKFVLIHALIVRIIACQKMILQPSNEFHGFSAGISSSPATPMSLNDWSERHNCGGSGTLSSANSGPSTPVEPTAQVAQAQHERKRLGPALDKWKLLWDTDLAVQYPPQLVHQKRFGFSRDGLPFFYLGRSFLSSQSFRDWTTLPDVRFMQTISLLKKIKQSVIHDGRRMQDIGSVGDIDDKYGLDDLNLDMKLLFKPHNSLIDSPVAGVRVHSL